LGVGGGGCLVGLEGDQAVVPADRPATIALLTLLLFLAPDPLQCLAELPLTHWSWCPLLLEDAADPPDLKSANNRMSLKR